MFKLLNKMENKKDNKGIIGLLLLGFGVYYLLKNKKNTPQSMPTSIVPTGTQLTGETNIMPTQNNQSVQTSTPSIMQTISDITTAPIIVPNYQSSVYPSVPAPSGYTYATPATGGEQYLQTTVRMDNHFVFEILLQENIEKWLRAKDYAYKTSVYKNYVYYLIDYCNEHSSYECRSAIVNLLGKLGLCQNQHKKNVSRSIV